MSVLAFTVLIAWSVGAPLFAYQLGCAATAARHELATAATNGER